MSLPESGGALNTNLHLTVDSKMEDDSRTSLSSISVESTKSMADIVRAMLRETKLSQAKRWELMKHLIDRHRTWICDDWKNGNLSVPDYACGSGIASQASASNVSRVVGIDQDESTVRIYNEVVKRLQHPTCTMQAYAGDLLPHLPTSGIPDPKDQSVVESLGSFDLAVISLGIDCFETLHLNPIHRRHELIENLKAIVQLLHENGTLLIFDVQRVSGRLDPAKIGSLVDGYKTTGYYSSDIVDALQSIGVYDIDALNNIRLQWVSLFYDAMCNLLVSELFPESIKNAGTEVFSRFLADSDLIVGSYCGGEKALGTYSSQRSPLYASSKET
ncbi:MAG: hypothetical protein Q9216_002738 [Gyalolechia sp. 2 TL-2023]